MSDGRGTRGASTDGARAEQAAVDWLQQHGVRIVARNYRCRMGEIDVIGLHRDTLLFVEVRLRGARSLGSAAESVTSAKQRRLTRTAALYLAAHPRWQHHPCRFDVMAAAPGPEGLEWQWLQQAFDASA